MRIIGIDPGSLATGFGIVESAEGRLRHVAHGTLKPPRSASLSERLAFLYAGLAEIVACHSPDVAVVERVFLAANARSALVLGHARGVALAALGAQGLPVHELAAREVKQAVVGTGRATKAQVQTMVTRLLALDSVPNTDAADALAGAICHAHAGPLKALGAGARRRAKRPTRSRQTPKGSAFAVRRLR